MDKDFRSNYAMMIPKGPYLEPKKSDSKKWMCRFVGHRWQNVMVTTRDKTLPEECLRCHKKRWLDYNHWRKKLSRIIILLKRWVDKVLRPLCFFGWHRWKATFRSESFSYGSPGGERHAEDNYRCARCSQTKTIKIY